MNSLIASITYDGEEYALDAVLDALKEQTRPDFDVLFVDNSTEDWYERRVRAALNKHFPERAHVLRATGAQRFDRILASRSALRTFALAHGYRHVLMFDSDVVLPNDALATFLAADRELASGIYLNVFERDEKPLVAPCIYIDVAGGARHATMAELLTEDLTRIGAAGLGCTFVARSVLEKIPFRLNPHGKGEDIMFYRDAVAHGVQPVVLSHVRCAHLHFPVGDPRNGRFDAARYRLAVPP